MKRRIPTEEFAILSSSEAPTLYKSRQFWEDRFRSLGLWPPMLAHDVVSQKYSSEIDREFPEFQLLAVERKTENRVVGIAHAVPLHIGKLLDELPETGWDWSLETAIANRRGGISPDSLCGLSITVLPEVQRRGVGRMLIAEILSLALRLELFSVVMPVRPISKEDHPLVSINDFITWHRDDGFHRDAWIRTHQKAGAQILKACSASMTVVAPLSDWQDWCGQSFSKPGEYVVKGCLAPARIDTASGVGTYVEPNIWMHYKIN